jgi:hypothetical protein
MNRKPYSRLPGKILPLLVAAVAIAASLPATPAAAQQAVGGMISPAAPGSPAMVAPGLQLHAVNPSLSLTAPATSPIEEQMQDDYAASLMSAQRQLLQQNPLGVTRPELSIGQQLNGYTGPR